MISSIAILILATTLVGFAIFCLINIKQSGFLFLFVGIMSAALLAAVYNRPVSHGISYADSDSITKTNGVTIVLYDKFNVFSTTNLKYYYASNENIKIQHQVNTNMFGNCVGTNVSVVVN